MQSKMDEILRRAVKKGASDIHVTVGKPPCVRINGTMTWLEDFPVITPQISRKLIYAIISEQQKKKFEAELELDCSYFVKDLCRFRVNVMQQKGIVEAVLRVIPWKIPTAEEIGLGAAVMRFAKLPRGLVLVTGPTGSGKSTTLACLIEVINASRQEHIITIEDPIEFVYKPKRCVIRQREVGADTRDFAAALKHVLRQDPDIILVGEMRDLETISLALTAAETGHLVFATLHTQDAPQTVDRIIDVFPPHQQQQVRVQLSNTLTGVVCQQLLPRMDGRGRIAAREIMACTPAVANLIREGKTHQIMNSIETGAQMGMNSMDSALWKLVRAQIVRPEIAMAKTKNPEYIKQRLGQPSQPPHGKSSKHPSVTPGE